MSEQSALATFRKLESPHATRIWYEVTDADSGKVVGRVVRWTHNPRAWEGWVRLSDDTHAMACTGTTRDATVRLMWDELP